MGIMGLEPELTMRTLLGRQVLRIKCCGAPMARKEAHSNMATDDRPWGFSALVLKCVRCDKEIELDLLLGGCSRDKVWPELERIEYPRKATIRMKEKAKESAKLFKNKEG